MENSTPPGGARDLVLVVDDDADIRELLALTLRHEGWEVVAVRSGSEALCALRELHPTVVLVDYQLPDMSGLELIRQARAALPDLPCIAVTGQGSERVAVEIMKAGAADYIVKPFEPREIVAVVRRAAEERQFRASRLYLDLTGDLAAKNALLEQQVEQLGRRMSETNTLYETAKILTSQLALGEVLTTVLHLAGQIFQSAAASVRLVDESGKNLDLVAHTGLGDEYCRSGPVAIGSSAAGRAVLSGNPVHVADVRTDELFLKGRLLARQGLMSLLCLPLLVRGRCIGVMTLYHKRPRSYAAEELRFLSTFAGTVSIAVDNARLYGEQSRMAITDGLTGLYNHKHFHETLASEVSRARRYGQPLSLILVDIDFFKAYNDTWGHQAGDALLRLLAGSFKAAARQNDLVARYGGEEFAFVLPQTDKRQATALAKRLCRAVQRQRFEGEEVLPGGRLTVSLGVAAFPEDAPQAAELVGKADSALYRAKGLGRNQVQAWHVTH